MDGVASPTSGAGPATTVAGPGQGESESVRVAVYDGAAGWYDRFWGARRDYAADVASIVALIDERHPDATTLLDVGCATGEHLRHLADRYTVTGVDISARLLEIAAAKLGDRAALHLADMRELCLGRRFDVIVCLWGSIAYAADRQTLARTAERMVAHLAPGGLVIVEPWLSPAAFADPGMVTVTVDEDAEPVLTVVAATRRHGSLAELDRVYVAATTDGIDTVEEHHRLGVFTPDEYRQAFADAGLTVSWHQEGLTGRGLLIGQRAP